MFKNRWLKDRRGIEGLPMRLIIILVVAIAVLAAIMAIINMIGTNKNMTAECAKIVYNGETYDGFQVPVDATGSEEKTGITFTAYIYVYELTKDGPGDPISGAKVSISGGNGFGSGTTDGSGLATITVSNCILPENADEVDLKIEVTKSGYNKFVDEEGIKIVRI